MNTARHSEMLQEVFQQRLGLGVQRLDSGEQLSWLISCSKHASSGVCLFLHSVENASVPNKKQMFGVSVLLESR